MARSLLHAGLALLVAAWPRPGAWPGAPPQEGAEPAQGVLGAVVCDVDGRAHRIGMEHGASPTVLVFLDPQCPVSRRYAPELDALAQEAARRGVGFHGVLSDPALTPAEGRAWRDEHELGFPVLFDASGDLAARLGPTHVPEAFVTDRAGRLVYRGRIDDRFAAVGKLRPRIDARDLASAIAAVAEGRSPATDRTAPVGCLFEAWKEEGELGVSYARDVAPILNASCVPCHRPGDVGPFPLTTYEEARRRARMIAKVTRDRFMPPWRAERGYGRFRDERHLSERQVRVLEAWAAAGAPEGDAGAALPPPELPDSRWRLGEPDLVVSMPVDFEVPATGDDVYRYFSLPSSLLEDRDVVALDCRPGDAAVVHHLLVYLDVTGGAARLDGETPEPGFPYFADERGPRAEEDVAAFRGRLLGGWAPGFQPQRLPPGLAWTLPGGHDLVLEVHYHLIGKATTDRSELGFYFAREPVERRVERVAIGTGRIHITPGDPAYRRRVWMELPTRVDVISVQPHAHFLARDVRAFATLPDGSREPLIHIPAWDFRWQDVYLLREPLRLPAGSRVEALFEYDNSERNPANPSSPPGVVQSGWRTTDEMCFFYLEVVPDEPGDVEALRQAAHASFERPAGP